MAAEKGGSLPKFGAWDEQDPSSGDGFTVIFNNARNEKNKGGPALLPEAPARMTSNDQSVKPQNPPTQKSYSIFGCCFGSSNAA